MTIEEIDEACETTRLANIAMNSVCNFAKTEIERLEAINAELVAACVGVVNLWHKNAWSVSNPYYKKIQAALAKAKGE